MEQNILSREDILKHINIDYMVKTYSMGPFTYIDEYIPYREWLMQYPLLDHIPTRQKVSILCRMGLHKWGLFEVIKEKGRHVFCTKCGKESWK